MRRIETIIILLLVIIPSIICGQSTYVLQWDKPYYAAGETVQYSISAPTHFVNVQGVVQVKVFPNDRQDAEHISFIRTGGSALSTGYFDISIDAPSGQYNIVLSALDKSDAKVKAIGEGVFTVINPFVDAEVPEVGLASGSTGNIARMNMKFIEGGDEQIAVQFMNDNDEPEGGMASYFITNLDQIYGDVDYSNISTYSVISDVVVNEPASELFYSNYAGDRTGNAPRMMGAYMTRTDDFIYANAKSEDFILSIDDFYGLQNIQLIDQGLNVFPVKRTDDRAVALSSYVDGEVVKEYVEDYINRRRIEQYFGSHEMKAEVSTNKKMKVEQKKASQTFNLKEYENFGTLSKFFEEVSTPLKMEQVDGSYTAQLTNPLYRGQSRLYFKGTPLFIIDGMVTTNIDFVAGLNFSSLVTVELYSNPTTLRNYYSMMGKSGVVKITTSIPNFSVPGGSMGVVSLNGIQEKREISTNTTYVQSERFPVFGSTLASASNVSVGSDGSLGINLPKTNEKGTFLITTLFRNNAGDAVVGQHTYSVN